jgi:hypothetical protein
VQLAKRIGPATRPKLIGVDSMMGRTGLTPEPQCLSQVPLWIATQAVSAVPVEDDAA